MNCQQSPNHEEYNFEKEVDSFTNQRLVKIKIQIKFSSDQKIIYSQNAAILRVVECRDALEKQKFFTNIYQIHNLSWQGQYGENQKKDGKWLAFWNKLLLNDVGGYYKQGQKQGLWKDLFQNFMKQAEILEIGEYYNDFRFGSWNYIYENTKIGCGFYNKDGQKKGKWIEPDEGFYDQRKVTYFGEYNLKNMKVGRWDIMYCKKEELEYKQIGGGSYDLEGNQKKIGQWIELDQEFCEKKQVTHNGEYNMNNMKVGRWNIMYCQPNEKEYKQMIFNTNINSGGGLYDQEGNQKKIGKWVELFEGFCLNAQVTFNGHYNMDGMKVGNWHIMYCKYNEREYKQIGGGSYDQEGNQKKIGKWVELDEKFEYQKQITYNGQYNRNSMKIGLWDIMFMGYFSDKFKSIGVVSYDLEGNQKKIGKWVELFEGFELNKQLIHYGEYNRNSMKVGRWDNIYLGLFMSDFIQSGGSYSQEGNLIKTGKWVELDEKFSSIKQVTHNGEYNINNMKVGKWDIMYREGYQYKKIGGGLYDQEGNQKKIGWWVELDEEFQDGANVTYNGEYNIKSMKVGRWDIMFCKERELKYQGGGSYDSEGNQKKIGKWVVLGKGFNSSLFNSSTVTYIGEYNMRGMKVGIWDIMYCKPNEKEYKQIGGGLYDSEGNQKKIGQWVELDDGFCSSKNVTHNGKFNKNGIKVGRWDIMFCLDHQQEYKQMINNNNSGGGSYDSEGNQKKIGKWVELHKEFNHGYQTSNFITYSGEYNIKGQKTGIWVKMDLEDNEIILEKNYNN